MDWESLYKVFLQYLQEHLDELEKDTEKFTEDFIKQLKENNYQITPELERQIDEYAKSMTETLQNSINFIAESVYTAAVSGKKTKTLPKDEFVKQIAKEVFERKYPDGLSLSERIWDWERELKEGLKKTVAKGIRQGIGTKKLVYDMQYKIERLTRTEFANVLVEETPKWLRELENSARAYIKNEDMRKEWERTVKKVEKYLKKLSRRGTYTASKTTFEKILKAVEEGTTKLIDKAVKWWTYDKQLYRLKAIAQTENANAYHLSQIQATEGDPDIIGYQWRLSRSHPRPDICDVYASIDYGLGKGVFPKDKVPRQKAHPFCLCYLLPKVKRKGMEEKETPEIPEGVLKRFAPEYIKDLEATGIDIKSLFDMELGAFKRKKDLMKNKAFKPLQTIGRVKRKRRWKKVKTKGLKKVLKRELGYIPDEVEKFIKDKKEIDSLMEHFFKRKYLPGEPIRPKKPEDLNNWVNEVLSSDNSIVLQYENRYIISDGKFGLVIEEPDKKITVYGLKTDIKSWKKGVKWKEELGTIGLLKKKLNI